MKTRNEFGLRSFAAGLLFLLAAVEPVWADNTPTTIDNGLVIETPPSKNTTINTNPAAPGQPSPNPQPGPSPANPPSKSQPAPAPAPKSFARQPMDAPYPLFINQGYPGYIYGAAACAPGSVPICGLMVPVPNMLPLGAALSLTVPSPYQNQPFTVSCVALNGGLTYQITDQSHVTCAPQNCAAQSLTVCGHPIDIPGGTKLGDSVTVTVPAADLSDPVYGGISVQAVCADSGSGASAPVYQLGDTSGVSCNNFTCPDTTIRLCNTNVPVKGGARLGERLDQTMPSPFAPDSFAVECLGSEGKAPFYQAVDITGVTCKTLLMQP